MEMSAVCVSKAVSSILHSPFSDQGHLQFYGHGSSSLTPSKLCFNTPCRYLPSVTSKPVNVSLRALCDSACKAPMELTAEQSLMKEITDLKFQMKQKKKELKSSMKDEKEKLKIQLKEGKKMKKQKVVQEGKTKMKCQSESSSSSSESSDEECASVSMKMLRQGQSMLEDASVNIGGGLGIAASVCASDTVEVCDGFYALSLGIDAMDICTEESTRVFPLGRDSTSMPSVGSFNGCISVQVHKGISGLEEHSSTCGMMSPCKTVSDSRMGFTANVFPSLHVSNRIEVCVGGKCKKAGSEQLLSALRGQIPGSSNVEAMPCKCMGKCSMAVNVRVHKEDTNPQHHSDVGVEDVSLILGHHFGLCRPSGGVPSLASKDGRRATSPLMMV